MAWTAPVMTTTRGRLMRHTLITSVCTFEGVADVDLVLDDTLQLPEAIIGGSVFGVYTGTFQGTCILSIFAGATTITSTSNNLAIVLVNSGIPTNGSALVPQPLFDNVTSSGFSGGALVLPFNDFTIRQESDHAGDTTETFSLYLGLLSHILEA
ncbi:MAG TPA: hypothetical protein VM118_14320 [Acidobacteriota bacterium]|nr:hypothetical protein [Acidobacteriota bacterium]